MTKFLTKAALAATVALFAMPAMAAPAGDVDFTAKAKIVKPVTIVNDTDLDFGIVTMNPTRISEKVTVSNAAAAVAVCGSTQLSCQNGGSADFRLSGGVANQELTLTFDTPPAVLTHTNGNDTVLFALNSVANVVLDTAGAGIFSIGGEITVENTTVDGDYSATVNVVANYL